MKVFDAIILGIVQGLSEFLPISSSGHLAVAQYLLGYRPSQQIFFDLILHVGTLVVILAYYRQYIYQVLVELSRTLGGGGEGKLLDTEAFWLLVWIAVASIPTGVIGILFRHQFEKIFEQPILIAVMFVFTGLILFLTQLKSSGSVGIRDLGWFRAFAVGVAQGLAIAPGISRSGMTIAAALLLGVNRKDGAKFSFLIAIPAIGGATLLELSKVTSENVQFLPLAVGGLTSAVVGYLALKFLVKLVERGKLFYFSFYLWAVASLLAFSIWK